jgi:hypothetical protein
MSVLDANFSLWQLIKTAATDWQSAHERQPVDKTKKSNTFAVSDSALTHWHVCPAAID